MMQLDSNGTVFEKEDCQYALRALETEAYGAIINAFRAKGALNQYYHLILEHLRLIFNISPERHKAEIRRALTDPILCQIAKGMNSDADAAFEWMEEAKRTCGNANFASALLLDSPSYYRFGFMRYSKNDVLLELADRLALLAVEHNRSKSVENGEAKFFQTLKRPKPTPSSAASNRKEIIPAPPKKSEKDTVPMVVAQKPQPQSKPRTSIQPTSPRKQKEPVITSVSSAPATPSTSEIMRKNAAGRQTKKAITDYSATRQRVGQLIAARSASTTVRGRGTMNRGRGGKRFTPTSPAKSLPTSPTRPASTQVGQYWQNPPPFYPFRPQIGSPASHVRPAPQTNTTTTPSPVVSNQPPIGQKGVVSRQFRKRPSFSPGSTPWQSGNSQSTSRANNASGSRVPVAPLAVMLPSTTAASRNAGTVSRYYPGSSSPTRPPLTGEAPGVYADDYNANAMDSSAILRSGTPTTATSAAQLQPHQFFSSTYFAQNPTGTPPKHRRLSPGSASFAGPSITPQQRPTIGGGPAVTGITVKAKKGSPGSVEKIEEVQTSNAASASIESATVPLRRLEQPPGKKLIVLPSAVFRRAQQHNTATATSQQAESPNGSSSQRQNLIIVRRATSIPSASTAASSSMTHGPSISTMSTSTTQVPPSPTIATPNEPSQEEAT